MATVNLGRIKPVFRGAYSGSTAYVVDDIVTHGNESFICIQAHGAGTQATSQAAYWTKLAAKGTDGTDVGTTITTQGDILYRDGSGLQRLAKPASDMYLKNTSGGVLSWAAVSSDYVKLASATGSNAATIGIDGYFDSAYKRYIIMGRGIRAANSSGVDLQWRLNTGGSANTSSVYVQTHWYSYTDTTPSHSLNVQGMAEGSVDVDAPATRFEFNADDFTDDEDTGGDLTIELFDPQASNKWKNTKGQVWFVRNDKNTIQNFNHYGVFKSTTACTGVTFQMRAGNIYGTFDLYGIKG